MAIGAQAGWAWSGELRPNRPVRITLKKAYADGVIAVDMGPR